MCRPSSTWKVFKGMASFPIYKAPLSKKLYFIDDFLFFLFIIFSCIVVSVTVGLYSEAREIESTGPRIVEGCETLAGAGNWTLKPWQSSKHSQPLSHLFNPLRWFSQKRFLSPPLLWRDPMTMATLNKENSWSGEMAQLLRTLASFAEDQSLIPSTQVGLFTTSYNSGYWIPFYSLYRQ